MVSTRRIVPIIIALAVLTIGGWLGSRYWLYSFLKSERCRAWLSTTLADHIGGTASVARLEPQSLDAIYCEEIALETPHPALTLKASQLRANVRFSLLSRFCDIDRLDITRAQLVMGESTPERAGGTANLPTEEKSRYALHEVATEDFSLIWPGGTVKKSAVRATPDSRKEGAWIASGAGGTARLTGAGARLAALDWRIEDYKVRWHNGDFHLVNAALRSGREASLAIQGSVTPKQGSEWTATYGGLPVDTITDGDWRARLKGNLSGVIHLRRSEQTGAWSHDGTVTLREGEVTALPILDSLASLTFTGRFRQLPLHHASMRFSGSGTSHTFSEIVIESTGQLRVEGGMTVTDGTVEGKFLLGLAPGDIRKIPGAATVFATEREGYLWTPVTLSGSIAAPAEDLSPRLVQAAAGEVVMKAGTLVRQKAKEAETTTRNVLDAVAPLLPLPVKPSSLLPTLPVE